MLLSIIIILIFLFGVFMVILKPEQNYIAATFLYPYNHRRFAHRGLYSEQEGIPENSIGAFQKAAERGFGSELDVRLTADGRLAVIHDADLNRICGVDKKVAEMTFDQLQSYPLQGTEYRIPSLEQVLEVTAGAVPLILELKEEGNAEQLCDAVAALLEQYEGDCCLESFHPGVVRYLKKKYPKLGRGLLSMDYSKEGKKGWRYFACKNLLVNVYCKPHFIAYRFEDRNTPIFRLCRKLYHNCTLAWTVHSEEQEKEAAEQYDMLIFEGYLPENAVWKQ